MITGMRYTKTLGNSAIYFRVRNSLNQFYNFNTLAWDVSDSGVNNRVYLTELPDNDPTESLYTCDATLPTTPGIIQEIVDSTDNSVIAIDISVPADTSAIQADLTSIKNSLKLVVDIQSGNWQILDKQMIFYDQLGVEVMRFDLFDKLGNKSEHSVFKRVKV